LEALLVVEVLVQVKSEVSHVAVELLRRNENSKKYVLYNFIYPKEAVYLKPKEELPGSFF
jgi:hypothetical protein